jgi:hypothetical protein
MKLKKSLESETGMNVVEAQKYLIKNDPFSTK